MSSDLRTPPEDDDWYGRPWHYRFRVYDEILNWVNVLLSGKYEQGRACLVRRGHAVPNETERLPDKYCCLGVLACTQPKVFKQDLATLNRVVKQSPYAFFYEVEEFKKHGSAANRHTDFLPNEVWDEHYHPILGRQKRWSAMNDEGCTFQEIARALHENLLIAVGGDPSVTDDTNRWRDLETNA